MRKLSFAAFLAVFLLSLGCATTDYPVIFDTRGADANAVMQSFYDKAYTIPSAQIATIWSDGTDELYTEVTQDWKGDQLLYTYDNFDPTGALIFLAQTYCDPVRQSNCAIAVAWNPDTADDNVFDYTLDTTCQGARSLSLLVSYTSRLGECGSGIWADKQGAAYEFSNLSVVSFRGKNYYHLPIDASIATFAIRGEDGAQQTMPIYGRFNGYVDDNFRTAFPITPNARYQLNWLSNWVAAHGHSLDVNLTYGSLNSNFKVNVTSVQNALNRL